MAELARLEAAGGEWRAVTMDVRIWAPNIEA